MWCKKCGPLGLYLEQRPDDIALRFKYHMSFCGIAAIITVVNQVAAAQAVPCHLACANPLIN